jgi:hypothetical protein
VCAVNYIKKGKHHYRSKCQACNKKNPKRQHVYLWQRAGYQKDSNCFLCTNVAFVNLRTVCLNCVEVVKKKEIVWTRGDLTVDY